VLFRSAQVALSLRTLARLEVPAIARAFLVPETSGAAGAALDLRTAKFGNASQERMTCRGLKPETVGEILTAEPDQVWVLALGGR
jgi:hypothetical protein